MKTVGKWGLAALFFLFLRGGLAQAYMPFPDSSCVWSVGTRKFLIKGDSLLNGKFYNKYFYTSDSLLSPDSLNFIGLVRQDLLQKKVYGIAINQTSEVLLYDFALSLNDTVIVKPFLIPPIFGIYYYSVKAMRVKQKDSVQINGQYRTRLKLVCPYNYIHDEWDEWIEGIGSVFGPLMPGMNVLTCGVLDDPGPYCFEALLCQKVGTVQTYVNPVFNTCFKKYAWVYFCGPTGIDENTEENGVVLYPNPTGENCTIKISEKTKVLNANISITNVLGEEVFSARSIILNNYSICTSMFEPGLYSVNIKSDSKTILNKKLVVLR